MRTTFADKMRSVIVIRRAVEYLNNIYEDPFMFVWERYSDTTGDVIYIRNTCTSEIVFSDWEHNIAGISPEVVRDNVLNGCNPNALSMIERRYVSYFEVDEEVGEELTNFLLGLMTGELTYKGATQ